MQNVGMPTAVISAVGFLRGLPMRAQDVEKQLLHWNASLLLDLECRQREMRWNNGVT